MAIDMHSHWIPPQLAEILRQRTEPPSIRSSEGHEYLCQPRGEFPLPPDYGSIERRLESMDALGIEACLLSLSSVFGVERLPVEESLELARIFVEGASAAHVAHPDRIFGLATLPIADIELATTELEIALELPGIVGALIPGNALLTLERAQPYRPIFEAAQRHGAHIMVHTGILPGDTSLPPSDDVDNAQARRVTLDMQSRISSNMVTLCLTDFLDDYPNVTVQCHNLGGNIPFEIDRLDHISLDRNPDMEPPSERIRKSRVLVDCNSMGARSIERAVQVYGADRIMFGTDGTRFGAKWSAGAIQEAELADDEKQAILSENARTILGL